MKKISQSGKWAFNGKAAGGQTGVDYWNTGNRDAINNAGCRVGELGLAGHLKKCYMNGYKEGQSTRAARKRNNKP